MYTVIYNNIRNEKTMAGRKKYRTGMDAAPPYNPSSIGHVQFRAGSLAPGLAERTSNDTGSPGATAKRDLERYYHLLAVECPTFELNEARLIVEALNSEDLDWRSARFLWALVDDAMRKDGLDTKWEVDGPALVARLRELTAFQGLAVLDSVERTQTYWARDHDWVGFAATGLIEGGEDVRRHLISDAHE